MEGVGFEKTTTGRPFVLGPVWYQRRGAWRGEKATDSERHAGALRHGSESFALSRGGSVFFWFVSSHRGCREQGILSRRRYFVSSYRIIRTEYLETSDLAPVKNTPPTALT